MDERFDKDFWLPRLRACHEHIRTGVLAALRRADRVDPSEIVAESAGDVVFRIDTVAETRLLEFCEKELSRDVSFVLICEGLEAETGRVFPEGASSDDAAFRLIFDPIDGTRPLMFDKRSGWILTGVAPNRPDANLSHIFFALQTEIPFSKQSLADQLWAAAGEATEGRRTDLRDGKTWNLQPRSSAAETVEQSFAGFVHYFHGSKTLISEIDEALARELFGPPQRGRAWTFEDQYMSTGGQMYELATGRDRFVADLRALVEAKLAAAGETAGLCCHPYDLCTWPVAQGAGAVITEADGRPPAAPLNTTDDVSWIGYGNEKLRRDIEPALQRVLRRFDLL